MGAAEELNIIHAERVEDIVKEIEKQMLKCRLRSEKYTTEAFDILFDGEIYSIDADVDERCEDFNIKVYAIEESGLMNESLSDDLTYMIKESHDPYYKESHNQAMNIRKDQLQSIGL